MRITEIIGRVTLNKRHPSLSGATWLLGVPLTLEGLRGGARGRGEPIVIYDDRGASPGALIAISEGAEASAPFHPHSKPIDAYNSAILDTLEVEPA